MTKIIPFKKAKLVAGLFWQAQKCLPKDQAAAATKLVQQIAKPKNGANGKSYGSVRDDGDVNDDNTNAPRPDASVTNFGDEMILVGFAETNKESGKLYSLALLVNEIAIDNGYPTWAAVIGLGDGQYWFGSASNGMIWPDSDIIDSEEAVISAYSQSSVIGDEGLHCFVSEDVALNGADKIDLASSLEQLPQKAWKKAQLTPIKFGLAGHLPIKSIAVTVALLGIAFAGMQWWQAKQNEELAQALEDARKAQAALAAQRLASTKKPVVIPVNQQPWADIVGPGEMLTACANARSDRFISPAGWNTDEFVCVPGAISATFTRTKTSASAIDLHNLLPAMTLMPGGEKASVSYAVSMPVITRQEQPWKDSEIALALLGPLQSLGLSPALAVAADVKPPVKDASGPSAATAPAPQPVFGLKHYKFTLSGDGDLLSVRTFLASVPTLRLSRINLSDMNKIDLEGDVYAQP